MIFGWLRRRRQPVHKPEIDHVATRQLKIIRETCTKHLGAKKTHGRRTDQISVVVPYEDILRIWDMAEQLRWRI